MRKDEPERDKYCRSCGYNLRGLAAGRCPECGGAFDPGNRATYLLRPPAGHRRRVVVGIYVAPVLLSAAFWTQFVLTRGAYYGIHGPGSVVRAVAFAGLGPLPLAVDAFLPASWASAVGSVIVSSFGLLCTFGLLWGGWFALLWHTPLHRVPYIVHVILAFCWWFVGFVTVGISV